MKIRSAKAADLTAIADLHIESWQNSYVHDLPHEFLQTQIVAILKDHWRNIEILDADVVLVAESARELIGFIAVWCRPVPLIDHLHVRQAHRSSGVGAQLMRAAAKTLLARGKTGACLWVFESNAGAIRFYETLGASRKASAMLDIFGQTVPSTKLAWDDLSCILSTK